MSFIDQLIIGFSTASTPVNLLFCFLGALIGTLIGVLPGIGPTAAIAMLLPIALTLTPEASLIMLAGIYYGAQYGGSTTAILINVPGESSAAVTALTAINRSPRTRRARTGRCCNRSVLRRHRCNAGHCSRAPPLTAIALQFGPAEYVGLIVLGLISSVVLAHGSVLKALAVLVFDCCSA